jgi:hypothetical protein
MQRQMQCSIPVVIRPRGQFDLNYLPYAYHGVALNVPLMNMKATEVEEHQVAPSK